MGPRIVAHLWGHNPSTGVLKGRLSALMFKCTFAILPLSTLSVFLEKPALPRETQLSPALNSAPTWHHQRLNERGLQHLRGVAQAPQDHPPAEKPN